MKRTAALIAVAALLTGGCGHRADLVAPVGTPGPAVPVGSIDAPTPTEQTTPSVQARPERSDELLSQSEERKADPFDLPPT